MTVPKALSPLKGGWWGDSGVTVTIRACGTTDAKDFAALYTTDREELDERAESFVTTEGQVERITQTWPQYDCEGFVILDDDRVVGLLLEDIADDTATLGYYVAASARGNGVATAAVGAVIPRARDEGLRRLVA